MKMKTKKLVEIFKAIGKTSFAKKNTEDVEELNTVKIAAAKGTMQIMSVNSRICTAFKIDHFESNVPFVVTIDNSTLPSFIEAAADANGEVEFQYGENGLMAVGQATVPLTSAQEKQTKFPCVKSEPIVSALACDIVKAINAVSVSVNNSSANEVLKNVKLEFDAQETSFKMTSMNNTTVTVASIPLEDMDDSQNIPYVLCEGEVLGAIVPILGVLGSQLINISIADGRLMLSSDNAKIVINCSFDKFVDYSRLLTEDFSEHVTFNSKELKKSINAIYKVVKTGIQFASDGTHAAFKCGNYQMPANIIESTNNVRFAISVTILKNMVANLIGETITLSVAKGVVIKARSELGDVCYITCGVRM